MARHSTFIKHQNSRRVFFFVFASVFLCHYSTILRHVHAFSNAKQANIVWTGHAVCSVTFAKILFIHVGLVNSHQF